MSKSLINARVASGGWVPMGQGAATAITPQGGRTPTGLPTSNPNTSPSPPLRHPSHWGQKPSGSKMNKPLKQREKKPGRRETLNQKSGGGRATKRNATLLQCHAMLTKLRVQCTHNVGTWPVHSLKRHTAGQESAPKLTNNGKRYKRKHSHATALQIAKTPPKNAKTLDTIAPSR